MCSGLLPLGSYRIRRIQCVLSAFACFLVAADDAVTDNVLTRQRRPLMRSEDIEALKIADAAGSKKANLRDGELHYAAIRPAAPSIVKESEATAFIQTGLSRAGVEAEAEAEFFGINVADHRRMVIERHGSRSDTSQTFLSDLAQLALGDREMPSQHSKLDHMKEVLPSLSWEDLEKLAVLVQGEPQLVQQGQPTTVVGKAAEPAAEVTGAAAKAPAPPAPPTPPPPPSAGTWTLQASKKSSTGILWKGKVTTLQQCKDTCRMFTPVKTRYRVIKCEAISYREGGSDPNNCQTHARVTGATTLADWNFYTYQAPATTIAPVTKVPTAAPVTKAPAIAAAANKSAAKGNSTVANATARPNATATNGTAKNATGTRSATGNNTNGTANGVRASGGIKPSGKGSAKASSGSTPSPSFPFPDWNVSGKGKSPAPPFVNSTQTKNSFSHTTVINHTTIDTVITTITNNQTNTTHSVDINGNPKQYPWAAEHGIPGALGGTPGAAAPSPAPAKKDTSVVAVRFTLTNMDYSKLKDNTNLTNNVIGAIKEGVLLGLPSGYDERDINVVLSAGSVIAEASITPKPGMNASQLSNDFNPKVVDRRGVTSPVVAGMTSKVLAVPNLNATFITEKADIKIFGELARVQKPTTTSAAKPGTTPSIGKAAVNTSVSPPAAGAPAAVAPANVSAPAAVAAPAAVSRFAPGAYLPASHPNHTDAAGRSKSHPNYTMPLAPGARLPVSHPNHTDAFGRSINDTNYTAPSATIPLPSDHPDYRGPKPPSNTIKGAIPQYKPNGAVVWPGQSGYLNASQVVPGRTMPGYPVGYNPFAPPARSPAPAPVIVRVPGAPSVQVVTVTVTVIERVIEVRTTTPAPSPSPTPQVPSPSPSSSSVSGNTGGEAPGVPLHAAAADTLPFHARKANVETDESDASEPAWDLPSSETIPHPESSEKSQEKLENGSPANSCSALLLLALASIAMAGA